MSVVYVVDPHQKASNDVGTYYNEVQRSANANSVGSWLDVSLPTFMRYV